MDGLSGPLATGYRVWWQALRPQTLSLSLAPVVMGSAVAWAEAGRLDLVVLVLAALAAGAIQIGTNLWNDALDGERGVDGTLRMGPVRVTASGLLAATRVRRAALGAFALASAAGLGLVVIGGPVILAIGLAAIACGLLYSAGPVPIAATPLGEAVVLAFFGIAGVAGTVVAHGVAVDGDTVLLGALTGLPAAAVLLVNNHRDRVTDAASGRRTLAIIVGPHATSRLYAGLLVVAAWCPLAAAPGCLVGGLATAGLLGVALVLGRRLDGAPLDGGLNRMLPATARYQLALVAATTLTLLLCG